MEAGTFAERVRGVAGRVNVAFWIFKDAVVVVVVEEARGGRWWHGGERTRLPKWVTRGRGRA